MDGTKATIRQEMRRRRRALSAVERAAVEPALVSHLVGLEAFRRATCVIAYVDTDGEVPPGALIEAAFAPGKRLSLPRLIGETMRFAEHRRGTGLRPGARGIPEPVGDELEERDGVAALACVPLLAW